LWRPTFYLFSQPCVLRQCLRDFSAAFYDAIVLRENLAAAKQDSS
jgi:hypothetical protein